MNKKSIPKDKQKPAETKRKQPSRRSDFNEKSWLKYLLAGVVLLITWYTFHPALKNQITNWDDNVYLMDNLMMQKPFFVAANYFFTHFYGSNYFPFPMLTYCLEWNAQKFNPEIYHLVNILFHLLNVVLVFWFIYLLSEKKTEVAVVVAVLFGIHPMHVESVAWIAELKDVEYSFFFLLGLISYYKYIRGISEKKVVLIVLAFVFFICSGFSKPAAVTFSLAIILIDFYTKRKFDKWVMIEKIPFILLSVVIGFITIKAQQDTAIARFEVFSVFHRFLFASYSFLTYLYKLILPVNLSAYYPYPHLIGSRLPYIFYAAPFICLAIFILVFRSYRFTRIIAFGFLFFFANIFLVLQFISVGSTLVSERYSYIPYVGLFFIIGMGFSWIYRSKRASLKLYKYLSVVVFLILTVVFSNLSSARSRVWLTCETLWTDVINQFPDDAEAYKNRGGYLVEINKYDVNPRPNDMDRAFIDFNTAIKLKQNDPKIFLNRGNIYSIRRNFSLALADYSKAIQLDSSDFNAFVNRGITYAIMEKYDSAFADWDKVLKMHGPERVLYQNRAYAYFSSGKYKEAISDYQALEDMGIAPDATMYFYLAFSYFKTGNEPVAIEKYTKAIQLNPEFKEAYYNRAQTYSNLKKYKAAWDDVLQAQRLGFKADPVFFEQLRKEQR